MEEHQYHKFVYELRQMSKSLDRIIKLLEVNDDPNRKLTEEEVKKEYYPFFQPTEFEHDGTTPTTDGNERPFPV